MHKNRFMRTNYRREEAFIAPPPVVGSRCIYNVLATLVVDIATSQ